MSRYDHKIETSLEEKKKLTNKKRAKKCEGN